MNQKNQFLKKVAKYFKNKVVMVTGGTGSFGRTLVKSLVSLPVKKIIVLSRDEFKQYGMRNDFEGHENKLHFIIGDIRDFNKVLESTRGVDIIFHAAAMKHVPICEKEPMEAIKTNVIGAYNIKEAAIQNSVKRVVAISTDKAVKSVNVMGMTKAIQERLILANHQSNNTRFTCVRFGNVVGSNGSAIPFFKKRIMTKKPILLTDPRMTRFFMTLEDSLKLIYTATLNGHHGEIFVQKMPVAKITDIIQVLIKKLSGPKKYPIKNIGLREGEQLYESLVSEEEMHRVKEYSDHYVIHPYGKLKKPKIITPLEEYRSDLVKKIMSYKEIEEQLKQAGEL